MKARLNPGDVFASRFEIRAPLGSGAMGVVYHALDQEASNQEMALKLMHPALAEDAKSVHRFEREARAVMSIKSHHIARVTATGCDEERPWIAMEFAQGPGLRQFVEEHWPLSSQVQADILCQLFSAMRAAHSAGVVHRDLKPDNIIVTGDVAHPFIKVLDFGIAKSLASATALQTAPGQGTPLWTAPDQTRLDDVPHPRCDVWALGLLTFFIMTGKLYWRHAHGRSSVVELSMELVRNPIEPPSQRLEQLGLDVKLPQDFDDWFLRCVNRKPEERFENAGTALHGLMRILERREHQRHSLWLPVYCDALSGGVAITHDASDNGMLLLTRSCPDVGEILELRFSVPPGSQQQFTMRARVVRTGPNPDDPHGLWHYQLAVAFDQEIPELRLLLSTLEKELHGS